MRVILDYQAMRSFVEVHPDSHFSIQNLPYGVFSPLKGGYPRLGVAIGEMVLDLRLLQEAGCFDGLGIASQEAISRPMLNAFMALGQTAWRETRAAIQELLMADNPRLRDNAGLRQHALLPMDQVQMHLPVEIGDYTDFYSSKSHATNVGTMFRGKEKALQPNWLQLPLAYHGRASSVVVSGTEFQRPYGQVIEDGAPEPSYRPSQEVDFELEMGFFVGPGNRLGRPVPMVEAAEHIFGLVLVNDWSLRDVQRWEYRPLGPFLSKSLATSISPWVVTLEALEPFRCPGPEQAPQPLPYLRSSEHWAFDIELEIELQSEAMDQGAIISQTNFRTMYWNMAQQLVHHTSNGCNLRTGDLLASGTISGETQDSYGSMLELAWRSKRPVRLPNGELRTFLEDGDRVTMTGWSQGDGYRVGFGEVTGKLLPAAVPG